MNVFQKALAKYGTVVVDRRYVVGVIVPAILLFVGGPELVAQYPAADTSLLDTVMPVLSLILLTVNSLGVVFSWQKRAPSGLGPDEPVTSPDDAQLLDILRKAGVIK